MESIAKALWQERRLGLYQHVQFVRARKCDEDALLELADLVTLDHFSKELDAETKLQSKIDRLFKRFFLLRGMKQMAGLEDSPAPLLTGAIPVLELTATTPIKSSEEPLAKLLGRVWITAF